VTRDNNNNNNITIITITITTTGFTVPEKHILKNTWHKG
jgi:hypothetical protein